jgi:iron complex transport system substrate-binding protein
MFFSSTLVGSAPGFPVKITDATGTRIVLSAPPQRIVSLAPSVTETLFALGVDQEIVGISDADDYPPDRVTNRTRIGGVVLSYERIVALRPDLVIGMPSLQRDQLTRLRALGLPVLAVEAESVAQTLEKIRVIGQAIGRSASADELVRSLQHRIQVVQPVPATRVYIEAWYEPVLAATGGTLADDLAKRAGAINIFSDRRGYAPVPPETVLARNPQVIFLMYPGQESMLGRPGWRSLQAVRANRVHELPPDLVSRPGPRIVDGLALLSRLLHGRR